jgi:hypothetical protein
MHKVKSVVYKGGGGEGGKEVQPNLRFSDVSRIPCVEQVSGPTPSII